MPEELRPSKCKVAFESHPEGVTIAHVDKHRPDAWKNRPVVGVLKKLVREGEPVFVMVGKDRHLLLPKDVSETEAKKRARAAFVRVTHGSP
jgi:hypothetical protein